MKKIIISMLFSIISLFLMSLIYSIVVSLLQYNNGIKINPYVTQIISIIFFFISGIIFGLINKKQGLLGSLIFILVYMLFVIIINALDKTDQTIKLYYLFIIIKCFAYSIGSIISVNFKRS